MKRLSITYHMYRNYPRKETAETCITLPMTQAIADDILEYGEGSKHLAPAKTGENMSVSAGGVIYEALCRLSEMQGYHYEGFCTAETVFATSKIEVPLGERFLIHFNEGPREGTIFQLVELSLDELQAIKIEATHILKCRAAGKASMANCHYDSPLRISDIEEETADQLMIHMYDNQLEALLSAVEVVMKRTWGVG